MKIVRYNASLQDSWNRFVRLSRNGTFLHERQYMDYHADRFSDHSLLFYSDKDTLIALLPANEWQGVFYSHQGLTYGGLLLSPQVRTAEVLDILSQTLTYLRASHFSKMIYKCVPAIYHTYPAEEDLYALFRLGASLKIRNVSSALPLISPLALSENRSRGVKKALRSGLLISETADFTVFWQILEHNLREKHATAPVHSLSEIQHLKTLFPDQIRCFEVHAGNEVIAGSVLYITGEVVHIQYISATDTGRRLGALDLLFDTFIKAGFENKKWLDFGISTEQEGCYLNEGLIHQKEGFGGRAVVYDTYQIDLNV